MNYSARIGPIYESTTLDGEVIRIGGQDKTIRIHLMVDNDRLYKLEAGRTIAKQLAAYLFSPVRVIGTGKWYRTPEGQWELECCTIQEFEPIEARALIEAVDELRAIKGSEWQQISDPLGTWRELRGNHG